MGVHFQGRRGEKFRDIFTIAIPIYINLETAKIIIKNLELNFRDISFQLDSNLVTLVTLSYDDLKFATGLLAHRLNQAVLFEPSDTFIASYINPQVFLPQLIYEFC